MTVGKNPLKGLEWGEVFAAGERQEYVKHSDDKPRWQHDESGFPAMRPPGKRPKKGVFLMQYKEFDIYLYRDFFVLRWGRDPYRRRVQYTAIKEADEPRFEIPEDIQATVLAGRAMIFEEITK